MKVENKLRVYELNNEEIKTLEHPELIVRSHWCYDDRVVLEFEGKVITVLSRNLKIAIENAERR